MRTVMDLATQAQRKLSTQLESRVRDLEAATDCTLFRTKRKRHRDRNTKRKQVLQRYVDKPPSQRKRTPTHLVFQHDFFS